MNHPPSEAKMEYGSFRDPEGFVIFYKNRVFRAISDNAYKTLKEFDRSGLNAELVKQGDLISTSFTIPEPEIAELLRHRFPPYKHFLEH
jgi:hypothetical protein